MNVRLGFARLARVTAISYAILAVLIVASVTKDRWEEWQIETHGHTYTLSGPDGRLYVVKAKDEEDSMLEGRLYASANPAVDSTQESPTDVKNWTDSQLRAAVNNRFTPLGSKEKPKQDPIHIPNSRFDNPIRFQEVVGTAGAWAVTAFVIYLLFWAIFRGLRWVALGFLVERRMET